jgi:hypothetical protein
MSSGVGLATEFRSEKIPRNRLGMVSFIPRKKVLIPRHPEFYGRVNSEALNGRKWDEKKINLQKSCSSKHNVFVRDNFGTEFREFISIFVLRNGNPSFFSLLQNGSEQNYESLLLFLFHGTEFRAFFFSAERFRMEFPEFSVLRNSRNSAGTNQLFHLFRLPQNNFFVPTVFRCFRMQYKIPKDTY